VRVRFDAACDSDHDLPVVSRLPRLVQHRLQARDAAFGVGDRAFLLAPAGGRQQHVRIRSGGRGRIGFLHDHEFGFFKRLAHQRLLGQ